MFVYDSGYRGGNEWGGDWKGRRQLIPRRIYLAFIHDDGTDNYVGGNNCSMACTEKDGYLGRHRLGPILHQKYCKQL